MPAQRRCRLAVDLRYAHDSRAEPLRVVSKPAAGGIIRTE